jgi:arylsulfatase A-like enzyme
LTASRTIQPIGARKRRWLTIVVAIAAILTTSAAAGQAPLPRTAASRPNVVLVITDDMGYGDIGSYGATDIRTPNLDRLARDGVRLTESYANGAVCTPTRVALMTGRYQQRVGMEDVLTIAPSNRDRGLAVTGRTLPALLKGNGYVTGLFGKWHLGYKPEFGPNAHGFDTFFGVLSGATDFYTHQRGDGQPDLFENGNPVQSPDYLTDAITRRSVSFIDQHAGKPFFLEVAYTAPHSPFQPPDRPPAAKAGEKPVIFQWASDENPPTRQDYARMVERVDAGVGSILAALERHQLSANTLVIFTNDNGGEWLSRNAPFFHRKGTLWEGGIRVPLILRWPGQLPAGRVSPQVAITMDLTATILGATGTPVPSDYRLDGIDLLPSLKKNGAIVQRRLFWRRLPAATGQSAVRDGDWKLMNDGAFTFLFDVKADPGERNDLSARQPAVLRRLIQLAEEWQREVGSR